MTCDECRNLLHDLVDNEVGSAERSALEAHLAGCTECARMHRQVAKFTTTIVKTMTPLKTGADFASKVLARFEESKSDLTGVPDDAEPSPAAKTWPVWPFAAIVGVCVLAGVLLLFNRRSPDAVATLGKGKEAARVMVFANGGWSEVPGAAVPHGGRVEAVEAPGKLVEVGFLEDAGLSAVLRSPCKVQINKTSRQLELAIMQDAPGRLQLRVRRNTRDNKDLKSVLVSYKLARTLVPLSGEAVVDVEPSAAGELTVSVKKGAAQIFNTSEKNDIAEGYTRTVPQSGEVTPAVQIKSGALDWADHP